VSDEFRVEVRFSQNVTQAAVSVAELDLIETVFPELVLLAQRFDDSEAD